MPSTCSLFIRNARILLPDGEWLVGDVRTHRGEIVEIEPEIHETPSPDDIEIDATGLTLLPNTPSGMPGVETSLPLMLTQAAKGRCTVAQVSQWMSTNVAKAYGIPNKGAIAPGYDADLVLVDMDHYKPVRREELQIKCRWSPFEGWKLTGNPVVTIVGGQVVYDHGHINTDVRGKALTFTATAR